MYRPAHFVLDYRSTLFALMRRYDFATLVTMAGDKPVATHLPLLIEPGRGANGTLLGHVSRANEQWRGFGDGPESLAIFQGPHAYVSPRWYATTPLVPNIPRLMSAMCIEPPLPWLVPVARPKSSAIISLGSTPLAIQWPWPR